MSAVSTDETQLPDGYQRGSPMSGKDTLNVILEYCQNSELSLATQTISAIGRYTPLVQVGNIIFHASSHDTGCNVQGWILNGDEVYQFISTTYWYSSYYTFNESKWVHGAWDAAVAEAIKQLKELVAAHKAKREERERLNKLTQTESAAAVKARFEEQFKTSPASTERQS